MPHSACSCLQTLPCSFMIIVFLPNHSEPQRRAPRQFYLEDCRCCCETELSTNHSASNCATLSCDRKRRNLRQAIQLVHHRSQHYGSQPSKFIPANPPLPPHCPVLCLVRLSHSLIRANKDCNGLTLSRYPRQSVTDKLYAVGNCAPRNLTTSLPHQTVIHFQASALIF